MCGMSNESERSWQLVQQLQYHSEAWAAEFILNSDLKAQRRYKVVRRLWKVKFLMKSENTF